MTDENTDLNTSQSVADTDLNKAQTVVVQDLNQSVTGAQDETLADGSKKSEKTVKYEEFEKANVAKKAAEDALALTEQKLAQSVNLQQQAAYNQQAVQTQLPNSTYELAMQQLGLTDEDLYGENIRKVTIRTSELDSILQQQKNELAVNQQFIASHPDFTQVVGSVNTATGQIAILSQEALLLQQKKPYSFNSAQSAYEAVMEQREIAELRKTDTANKEYLARQGVDNSTAPLGGSAAGVGGAGDTNNQQMMSREQVLEIRQKVANGEQV